MLCEVCQQREATVHITTTDRPLELGQEPGPETQQHFCEECAHVYFSNTPGMGGMRGLICLSDSYRSRLYDQLEVAHPEAFQDHDGESPASIAQRAAAITTFLREQLKREKVEVNEDVFEMLYCDFIGSHHFYTRQDDFKRRKG